MMCPKCRKITGWLFLVVGLVFLLRDLGVWSFNFWGIQWYTAVFVIWGLTKVCSSGCADCNKMGKK